MSFNIGPYLKTVEALLGAAVTVGGLVLAIDANLPAPAVAAVASALGVLTTLKVWLVKNDAVVTEAVDAAVELGEGVASAGKR